MYTLEFVSSYYFFFFSNLLMFYTFRILLNEFVWDEQKLDIDVIWFFFFLSTNSAYSHNYFFCWLSSYNEKILII